MKIDHANELVPFQTLVAKDLSTSSLIQLPIRRGTLIRLRRLFDQEGLLMTDIPSPDEPSTFASANESVRDVARGVRQALDDGQPPGQWKVIVSDLVREAPLSSLGIAFLLGYVIARRR